MGISWPINSLYLTSAYSLSFIPLYCFMTLGWQTKPFSTILHESSAFASLCVFKRDSTENALEAATLNVKPSNTSSLSPRAHVTHRTLPEACTLFSPSVMYLVSTACQAVWPPVHSAPMGVTVPQDRHKGGAQRSSTSQSRGPFWGRWWLGWNWRS